MVPVCDIYCLYSLVCLADSIIKEGSEVIYLDLHCWQSMHLGVYNMLVAPNAYSKTCLKWPLKIDKTKILMTNGCFMKVESIAECSTWSILQNF